MLLGTCMQPGPLAASSRLLVADDRHGMVVMTVFPPPPEGSGRVLCGVIGVGKGSMSHTMIRVRAPSGTSFTKSRCAAEFLMGVLSLSHALDIWVLHHLYRHSATSHAER